MKLLKVKIFVLSLIIILGLLFFSISALNWQMHSYMKEDINLTATEINSFISKFVKSETDLMLKYAIKLSGEKNFKDAWLNKKFHLLLHIGNKALKTASSKAKISNLSLIDKNQNFILRLHSLNNWKRYDHNMLTESSKTKAAISSFDTDVNGKLVLRVIYPCFYKYKLLGYINIAKDITNVLEIISKQIRAQALMIYEDHQHNTKIIKAAYELIAPKDKIISHYSQQKRDNNAILKYKQKTFYLFWQSIKEIKGSETFKVVVLKDFTNKTQILSRIQYAIVALFSLLSLVLLFALYFYLSKLIKRFIEIEKAQHTIKNKLQEKDIELEEKCLTLKNILNNIDKEKKKIKSNIAFNLEKKLFPLLHKMKAKKAYDVRDLDTIKECLGDLASSQYKNLVTLEYGLTPAEIKVCQLLMNGYLEKEMANELNVAISTIKTHKKNIRKKFELSNKNINLKTFLDRLRAEGDSSSP